MVSSVSVPPENRRAPLPASDRASGRASDLASSLASDLASDRALEALVRTIRHQQGDFAIVLAHCNDPRLRRYEMDKLSTKLAAEVMEVALPQAAHSLLSTLQKRLAGRDRCPQAMVVTGLENAIDLDNLLVATNRVLNAFSRQFRFPIVLWVDDTVLRRLDRLAPDLKNRAPACIRFG